MRTLIICLLTAFVLSATSAYAGPGTGHSHSHAPATPVTKIQAIENASKIFDAIVKQGKLESSWAGIKAKDAKTRTSQYGEEWLVTFDNPSLEGKERNRLFIILTLGGKYLAATFEPQE